MNRKQFLQFAGLSAGTLLIAEPASAAERSALEKNPELVNSVFKTSFKDIVQRRSESFVAHAPFFKNDTFDRIELNMSNQNHQATNLIISDQYENIPLSIANTEGTNPSPFTSTTRTQPLGPFKNVDSSETQTINAWSSGQEVNSHFELEIPFTTKAEVNVIVKSEMHGETTEKKSSSKTIEYSAPSQDVPMPPRSRVRVNAILTTTKMSATYVLDSSFAGYVEIFGKSGRRQQLAFDLICDDQWMINNNYCDWYVDQSGTKRAGLGFLPVDFTSDHATHECHIKYQVNLGMLVGTKYTVDYRWYDYDTDQELWPAKSVNIPLDDKDYVKPLK